MNTETFWTQVGAYNEATSLVQAVLVIAAVVLTYRVFTKPGAKTDVLMKAFLSFAFARNGVVFFLIFVRNEWLDEGPVGIGTRFYIEKEIRGQVRRYDCVIERWEENRRFDFTAEAPGFSRLQAEWTLVPEGEGCRFTMREQINVQKANWLVDKLFVQRSARRAVQGF